MGFVSLIPSGIKMAILAALVAAVAVFYWHYTGVKADRDTALAKVGALEVTIATQNPTIDTQSSTLSDWKAHAEQFQAALNAMAIAQSEANTQARKLNNVLSKHDLERLSLAKPGLIERRINGGTADVLGMFESTTNRGKDGPGGRAQAGSTPGSP
jgi:uncharacterized coiled-coil protein SlyX